MPIEYNYDGTIGKFVTTRYGNEFKADPGSVVKFRRYQEPDPWCVSERSDLADTVDSLEGELSGTQDDLMTMKRKFERTQYKYTDLKRSFESKVAKKNSTLTRKLMIYLDVIKEYERLVGPGTDKIKSLMMQGGIIPYEKQ